MNNFAYYIQNPLIFVPLLLWELIWKGLALWKAAKKDEKFWYISILIINSVGILPITYLIINRKSK